MEIEKKSIKLNEFNNILKENEGIYRDIARVVGLSDSTFWILYALRDVNSGLTQSEICNELYQPKQTINSALKKMEVEGYIELSSTADRRKKQVYLTEQGVELAMKTVDLVILAERNALEKLSDIEQETFLNLFKKYTILLQDGMLSLKTDKH